ncbi:MAG: hypothetical protein ACI81R_002885 [Bradymonadia bacterium]|jgi:hypothetical protein
MTAHLARTVMKIHPSNRIAFGAGGRCLFGDYCQGSMSGAAYSTGEDGSLRCAFPCEACSFSTECADGFGCIYSPTFERFDSSLCGYWVRFANGERWLPEERGEISLRPVPAE